MVILICRTELIELVSINSFNGKEGDFLGPYPNPYPLRIGGAYDMAKHLEALPLPFKTRADGRVIMFIYDAPPPA